MPNFTTASKVISTVRQSDDSEQGRGQNRVLINRAANNEPLLCKEEADKIGMKIYNRWGEFMSALSHARRQYVTNFMSPATFFNVSIPKAPEEVRADWEGDITEKLNDTMKEGECALQYFELHRSRWAAVVAHGIGAMMWEDKYSWLPRYVAIEDLRIPTDTELSFRNLTWFAVRIAYTPGELSRKAFSGAKSKFKWDKPAVAALLAAVKEVNDVMAENNYDINTVPEKFEELRKQNAGYWSGDAMPTINLWHFYHQDDDKKWYLKVVPEIGTAFTAPVGDTFICQSEGAVADTWRQIIHVQFGDLNNKAPFMYHSVRSLGFALFEPCYWTDFTRCRLVQHTLDSFNIQIRVSDPQDRGRALIQTFQNLSVLKPGVTIVPNTERHMIDNNLVESTMAQTKQLQQEASTAYTANIDTGTAREQTAFETGVKVQQNNALLSGLMLVAFTYEKFAYKEICRRFCLEGSDDPEVIEFQEACQKAGIPKAWLDIKKWRIEPTAPLGNGNPTMAMVESENAMKLRPLADPSVQQEMTHDAAVPMIGAARARRWFRSKANKVSDAAAAAAAGFSTMMMGLPAQIPEGLNPIQQIQTLFGLTGGFIAKIEQTTKTPTPDQLLGLKTVAGYIGQLVQGMQGDTGNQPLFKKFGHELSQVNNEIKKLEQHLNMEMQKQQQANNPAGQKAQETMMLTQSKIQAKNAETMQKLKAKDATTRQSIQHKNQAFVADQQRKNVQTAVEMSRPKLKSSE